MKRLNARGYVKPYDRLGKSNEELDKEVLDFFYIQQELQNIKKRIRRTKQEIAFCKEVQRSSIGYEVEKDIHYGDIGDTPINMIDLIEIMNAGSEKNKVPPRPFIDLFIANAEVTFPDRDDFKHNSNEALFKQWEDELDKQFSVFNFNKLAPLSYRDGVPLLKTEDMVTNIRWRVFRDTDIKAEREAVDVQSYLHPKIKWIMDFDWDWLEAHNKGRW